MSRHPPRRSKGGGFFTFVALALWSARTVARHQRDCAVKHCTDARACTSASLYPSPDHWYLIQRDRRGCGSCRWDAQMAISIAPIDSVSRSLARSLGAVGRPSAQSTTNAPQAPVHPSILPGCRVTDAPVPSQQHRYRFTTT